MDAANDLAVMRFSTAALPERERIAVMRDFYGPLVARVNVEPITDNAFAFEATARVLPDLTLVHLVSSPVRLKRDRRVLADDDRVTLSLALSGGGRIAHVGRELTRTAGSAFLCSHADGSETIIPETSRGINISVPRKVLAEKVPRLTDHFMRPIAPGSEPLKLLVDYVSVLKRDHALTNASLRRIVAAHVHDLVALTLGASRDATEIAKNRGLRAARLRAIKADIMDFLAMPGLSLSQIASRQHVTPRYVQALFEDEGRTFSTYLLDQRLEQVYQMLRDPLHIARPIGSIALDAGFGDLSHFNRAFRRRYGVTPSDVRAAAKGERHM
jgi:AraC-like DNA-binding protein